MTQFVRVYEWLPKQTDYYLKPTAKSVGEMYVPIDRITVIAVTTVGEWNQLATLTNKENFHKLWYGSAVCPDGMYGRCAWTCTSKPNCALLEQQVAVIQVDDNDGRYLVHPKSFIGLMKHHIV